MTVPEADIDNTAQLNKCVTQCIGVTNWRRRVRSRGA